MIKLQSMYHLGFKAFQGLGYFSQKVKSTYVNQKPEGWH